MAKNLENMTIAELQKELERRTRERLIEKIEAINSGVTELVRSAAQDVLRQALGLRIDRWNGEVTIDYPHRGAESMGEKAMEALREHARGEFTKIIGETPLTLAPAQLRKARRAYQDALGESLETALREKAGQVADEYAARLLDEVSK